MSRKSKRSSAIMRQYEDLYNQLLGRAEAMHEDNKKRIRNGVIVLLLLPIILYTIRWLTDSDKVVFLIIYVFCMFAISAYLISIEYIDDSIQKTLKDVTKKEADFDGLIIDAEEFRERIAEKHEEHRAFILERRSTIWHPGRLSADPDSEPETEAQNPEASADSAESKAQETPEVPDASFAPVATDASSERPESGVDA